MATPRVGDSPDLQHGDGKRLQDAQRAAPIRRGQGGGTQLPELTQVRPTRNTTGLPTELFTKPTTRPTEPLTTGMDIGIGAGSEALRSRPGGVDKRELVLEYLANNYDNQDAYQMLQAIREERRQQAMAAQAPTIAGGAPVGVPPVEQQPGGGEELDGDFGAGGDMPAEGGDDSYFEGEPLDAEGEFVVEDEDTMGTRDEAEAPPEEDVPVEDEDEPLDAEL